MATPDFNPKGIQVFLQYGSFNEPTSWGIKNKLNDFLKYTKGVKAKGATNPPAITLLSAPEWSNTELLWLKSACIALVNSKGSMGLSKREQKRVWQLGDIALYSLKQYPQEGLVNNMTRLQGNEETAL